MRCLYCPSNCLTAAKAALSLSPPPLLSFYVSLTKRCVVLDSIMFSSLEPGEFLSSVGGCSVNPTAFDGDETVLDEACILPAQRLK